MFDQISGGGYVTVVRRASGRAQPLKKKNNEIYKISKKFFSNTEKEPMEHFSDFTVKLVHFMYSEHFFGNTNLVLISAARTSAILLRECSIQWNILF